MCLFKTNTNCVLIIHEYYFTYYQIELNNRLQNQDNYNIHFELCDIMTEWCQASSESECKAVYQKVIKKGIFLGEFIKTILKINNIALEIEKICKLQNNLKLLEIVKQIPILTLKSVATNQSLYL